jgi:hypothetical protein
MAEKAQKIGQTMAGEDGVEEAVAMLSNLQLPIG